MLHVEGLADHSFAKYRRLRDWAGRESMPLPKKPVAGPVLIKCDHRVTGEGFSRFKVARIAAASPLPAPWVGDWQGRGYTGNRDHRAVCANQAMRAGGGAPRRQGWPRR